MTATAELISALVAGGMNAAEAAGLVARAAVEMTGALTRKSSGATRQQRYRERNKASQRDGLEVVQSVTNRNETVTRDAQPETSQTVTKRNESVTRDAPPLSSIKTDIEIKRDKRGTRLSPGWSPSDADRTYARSLGWAEDQIDREAENFRDYWLAKAGGDAAKTDWGRTWSRWIRNSKIKPNGAPAALVGEEIAGFYAKFGSLEQDAWDAYGKAKNGKPYPRDRKGGWHFPSKYPPGYENTIIADVQRLVATGE